MGTEKASAGALRERVTLSARETRNPDEPNDYGNTVADWVDQGTVWAQYLHLRGGESVMAGRLAGRHTQVIRVRASEFSRSTSTEWKVTDTRSGQEFNIREVTLTPDRMWVELLCESGVAI